MRISTIAFCCLGLVGKLFGQSSNTSASVAAAYPISLYKSATLQTQNLYNGRQYYVYDPRNDEHQFFERDKWQTGALRYDGQQFDSIPMLYDIVRDELVIKHFYGDHLLLQSEKVDYFWIDKHIFKRLESGKEINSSMRTGFYDVLYAAKTQVIVRRSKSRQEKIAEKRVMALFPQKNLAYISKDGTFYPVHSKKSLYAIFPERKREFRKLLRENHIRFRKNREVALVRIAAAYDETAKP